MLDKSYLYKEKSKWVSFNGSIVNFDHVIRVYTRKEKPALIIEFIPQGHAVYEFESEECASNALKNIFEFLKD